MALFETDPETGLPEIPSDEMVWGAGGLAYADVLADALGLEPEPFAWLDDAERAPQDEGAIIPPPAPKPAPPAPGGGLLLAAGLLALLWAAA